MSDIRTVTVLGTGVLGSQIAFQTAFHGFDVVAYDISDEILEKAKERFAKLAAAYRAEVEGASDETIEATLGRIRLTSDLADAVKDADLVIEAVPEITKIKVETYEKLAKLAPEKTIFATNSSTLLPSALKDATGRPDRFLALHFANKVWKYNTAEIMGTPETSPDVFDTLVDFAGEIGMVPIPLHREKAGYVINSLLVPWLNAAMALAAGGFAEPADIDRVWRIDSGSPNGPFQILDVIGLETPYNIMQNQGEQGQKLAAWLKENYIDKGKLGVATGEGFYRYDS